MEAALPFTSIIRLVARRRCAGAASAGVEGSQASAPVAAPAAKIWRREKIPVIVDNLQNGLILFKGQSPEDTADDPAKG
jgi:hypothetical protein